MNTTVFMTISNVLSKARYKPTNRTRTHIDIGLNVIFQIYVNSNCMWYGFTAIELRIICRTFSWGKSTITIRYDIKLYSQSAIVNVIVVNSMHRANINPLREL